MSKTEQMRRVLITVRVVLVVAVFLLFFAVAAKSGDSVEGGRGYSPSIVDGLFAVVVLLLGLVLNSQRARIGTLEATAVTKENCGLKREKDEEVVKALTASTKKTEGHVEEIFKTCNEINVNLALLTEKSGGS